MLFTDSSFWVFFVCFCIVYAVAAGIRKSLTLQNIVILAGSYFAYGSWDWRFLFLIVALTAVTYFGAILVENGRWARTVLWAVVGYALAALFLFKYFNFFASELNHALMSAGLGDSSLALNVILPVGISFYTFQAISYVVDVRRGHVHASRDFIRYAAYLAFFPQLVAGPIERAADLLTQFGAVRPIRVDLVVDGLRLILLGLAFKVVVADNLAPTVDAIFAAGEPKGSGGVLAIGALYFAVQIYGDFCGYSLIAVGLARILGFELMMNFRTPYLSASIGEFWRRWHISLSTFFRDYVYIPLGGNRRGRPRSALNLITTFVLSGLWHGANWTFIVWGFYHGLLVALQRAAGHRMAGIARLPGARYFGIALTFGLVCLGWIFFRAPSVGYATDYIHTMLMTLRRPETHVFVAVYVLLCLAMDLAIRLEEHLREKPVIGRVPAQVARLAGLAFYTLLFWLVVFAFQRNEGNAFIYFQF